MRGGVELSNDDLRGTVTCEQSTTVASCSHTTTMCSLADPRVVNRCQLNESQSLHACCTVQKCSGVVSSDSGIVCRGFATALDQTVGLASIRTPDPPLPASRHEIHPNDTRGRSSSCGDLDTNDLQWEACQCQKVVRSHTQGSVNTEVPSVGIASVCYPNRSTSGDLGLKGHHLTYCQPGCATAEDPQPPIFPVPDPHSCSRTVCGDIVQPNDLCTACDLHSILRPSNNLRVESGRPSDVRRPSDDRQDDGDTVGTSSPRGRQSPFCCNYSQPRAQAGDIRESTVSVSDARRQSLYHELCPYISDDDDDNDDESNEADSCSITTDEEF